MIVTDRTKTMAYLAHQQVMRKAFENENYLGFATQPGKFRKVMNKNDRHIMTLSWGTYIGKNDFLKSIECINMVLSVMDQRVKSNLIEGSAEKQARTIKKSKQVWLINIAYYFNNSEVLKIHFCSLEQSLLLKMNFSGIQNGGGLMAWIKKIQS